VSLERYARQNDILKENWDPHEAGLQVGLAEVRLPIVLAPCSARTFGRFSTFRTSSRT
jgi:hypothetical protein